MKSYVCYSFGHDVWLIPKDLVTDEFTSAYKKIISSELIVELTQEETAALDLVLDSNVRCIEA